jgi:serine/threonine protein kinase
MGATAAVHPADPILQAYGLGRLDDVSSASVSKHLERCDSCQRRVAELSSDEFLGRLQNAQVKADKATSGWSPSASSSTEGASRPVVPPPPADTLPPELVDHPDYEIVRELGRGGMGVVYLVKNRLMGRLEVLKVIGRHLVERPGVVDRFLREIRSAAKLQHPNIVTAYTAMRLGESLALSMEFVDGLDLARTVKAKGPLPVVNACYFINQAALGLQHAHERGMVHRDIKPANLILARDGKKAIVKVLDFGLAKVTSEGQTDSGLTREGQMLGTPDYIAPEQIRNAQLADIRADIYSLGCTFYYLLTGGPPFRGDHLWDVYQAHFSMDAGPLNLVRPEIPVELAAVVAKMMAKEPDRRFQTPGEVARALTPYFKSVASQTPGSRAEVLRVETQVAPTHSSSAGTAPTRSATPVTDAVVTTPSPLKTVADVVAWDSLIEIKEDQSLIEAPKPKRVEPKPAPVGRSPWAKPAIIAASVFGALALGVIFYVATDKGRIKIIVDGPARIVSIDGETARIEGLAEPITLRAGEHELTIERGDIEVQTRKFVVRRGDNEELRVEYEATNHSEVPVTKAKSPSVASDNAIVAPRPSIAAEENSFPTGGNKPIEEPGARSRRAAQAALSLGGSVTVRVDGRQQSIEAGKALPTEAFQLTNVRLGDQPRLTDAELEPFQGLTDLIELRITKGLKVTDAGVAHLRNLRSLKNLWLNGTSVTDASLEHLAGFPTLEALRLRGTRVTDAGLEHLKGLSKLKLLGLASTRVTDAGLEHLRGLAHLESLWLEHTPTADTGLVYLRGLTKLRSLLLVGTAVTDVGLVHLQALSQLETLRLGGTHVTDAGLVHLAGLSKLKLLSLDATAVTDAGLEQLRGLTQLKELNLNGNKVTNVGVARLKEILPACRIIANRGALEPPSESPDRDELNRAQAGDLAPGVEKGETEVRVAKTPKQLADEKRQRRREQMKIVERMANLPAPEVEGRPWLIVGDELVSNPQGPGQIRHGVVYFGHPDWSIYDFSYKIKVIDQSGKTNARFHVLNSKTFRAFELAGGNNSGKDLFGRFNGVWDKRAGGGFIRPGIEFGRWYSVEIQVRKGLVTLFFDGQKIVDARRNDDLQNGRLGFFYERDEVHIRDVAVKALDGTPLWKGVVGLGVPIGE